MEGAWLSDSYHLWSLWFLPQGKTFTVFIEQYFYFLFKKRICKMFLGLLFLLYELKDLCSFSSSNVKNVRLFNWNFILFLPPHTSLMRSAIPSLKFCFICSSAHLFFSAKFKFCFICSGSFALFASLKFCFDLSCVHLFFLQVLFHKLIFSVIIKYFFTVCHLYNYFKERHH